MRCERNLRGPGRRTLRWAGLWLATTSCQRAGAPAPLPAADPAELARLAREEPAAAALVGRGEAALAAGRLEEAAGLFRQARQAGPRAALPDRRHCLVLRALERRDEAQDACNSAVQQGGGPYDLRGAAGALMIGTGAPTVDEVARAHRLAAGAQRLLPGQPWGYAALGDVARRLGDKEMTRMYLIELERLAPQHHETMRAAALAPRPRAWPRALGWAALLLVALGTLARVLRRRAAPAAWILVGALAARPAAAAEALPSDPLTEEQHASAFKVNDADPEGHLPTPQQANASPIQFGYLLMDLAGKADTAQAAGDHRAAIKYYRALAKAVPERSVSFAKICQSYEALGEREQALGACKQALGKEGARIEDHERTVRLLLAVPGAPTAEVRADVEAIIAHLRGDPAAGVTADQLACDYAVAVRDRAALAACAGRLTTSAPRDPRTVSYQWTAAIERGDGDEARRLVEQARALGVRSETLAKMEQATRALVGWQRPVLVSSLVVLVGVAAIFGWRRRRGTAPVVAS